MNPYLIITPFSLKSPLEVPSAPKGNSAHFGNHWTSGTKKPEPNAGNWEESFKDTHGSGCSVKQSTQKGYKKNQEK